MGVVDVDKLGDVVVVLIAATVVASSALVESIARVHGRMMVSVLGKLVFVLETAHPGELTDQEEPLSCSPIFGYDCFALLSHVAEDN